MALGESFVKTVVFVGTGAPERRLLGTGFIAAVPAGDTEADGDHPFVVTASHVVRSSTATFVTVRSHGGEIVDLTPRNWVFHPKEDVAVANIDVDPAQYDIVAVPEKMFVDKSEHKPVLGEDLYFVGLLGQIETMGQANTPMVRTGTLGALYQQDVPMIEPPNTQRALQGHLIDCRSFGGFSGSPCFMHLMRSTGETKNFGLRYPETYSVLLGMVGGHFDHRTSVLLPDASGKLSIPTSAGVGVVYPAEIIRETLELALSEDDIDSTTEISV